MIRTVLGDIVDNAIGITLPHEQYPNPYASPDLCFRFHYFANRKLHFLLRARALVAFPGGFGTLDEIFETATLIQTGKIRDFPLVLVGTDFWRPLIDFIRNDLVRAATIDPIDAARLMFTDSPAEAVTSIRNVAMRRFGLSYGARMRRWFLGE